MITEEQRRALFALREALRLCEGANLSLSLNTDGPGLALEALGASGRVLAHYGVCLVAEDIDRLLAEHPE